MSSNSKKFIREKISDIEELERLIKECLIKEDVTAGSTHKTGFMRSTSRSEVDKPKYDGPLVTVSRGKRFIGDPSIGLSPEGFWSDFQARLEKHVNEVYPEIKLDIDNLGVTRDLEAAAFPSSAARVAGSKHGAGLAQDVYMHTAGRTYTSFRSDNPVLAADQKLVDAIITFMQKPENSELRWGGAFGKKGSDSLNVGEAPTGRGILEFHHFEFKDDQIPAFFEPYKNDIQGLDIGLAHNNLNSTGKLATLYKALAEGLVTKKLARYALEHIDWDSFKE